MQKKHFCTPPSENVTISPAPPSLNTQAGGRLLEKLHSVLEHLEGGVCTHLHTGWGAGGDSLWAVNFEVQKISALQNKKKRNNQGGGEITHSRPPPRVINLKITPGWCQSMYDCFLRQLKFPKATFLMGVSIHSCRSWAELNQINLCVDLDLLLLTSIGCEAVTGGATI